jgi:hypothetical protein
MKSYCCFLLSSQWSVVFAVFGKTRILLGNPYTPIERCHKKTFFKKSNALVQKIQLDEHGKFRYYVIFARMEMLIYKKHTRPTTITNMTKQERT